MKTYAKLSLLAIALVMAGCNEQISPTLQNSGVVAPPPGIPGTPTPTTNYSFKIVNKSQDILNYRLHKTGAGNAISDCEVTSAGLPFSNSTFGIPAVNDITCFLEAEELSLYLQGFAVEVEATPNTCDFVAYSPFSYYNRIPGDSTGTYNQITCTNTDTTNSHVADVVPAANRLYFGGSAGCNQWVSESPLLSLGTRQAFIPDSDEELCRFNYPNETCDVGTVSINEFQVTFDVTAAAAAADAAGIITGTAAGDTAGISAGTAAGVATTLPPGDPAYEAAYAAAYETAYETAYEIAYNIEYPIVYAAFPPTLEQVNREIKCGGKVTNCIAGPIKGHSNLTGTRGSIYTTAVSNAPVKAEYSYPSLYPNRIGTLVYANYRRDLSNKDIAYGISIDPYMNPFYANTFINQKTFDPNVMERFSRNRQYEGISPPIAISTAAHNLASIESNTYSARPLAADPFMGMNLGTYTNPFYTFECLDTAREPKARIRLMIRDWDRLFPSGANASDIELLTDIYQISGSILARQDNSSLEPYGNYGDWDNFNDYFDWDDLFGLERDAGLFIFRPINGYFSPASFPNENNN